LVANDIAKAKQNQEQQDPRLQTATVVPSAKAPSPGRQYTNGTYYNSPAPRLQGQQQNAFHDFPASPHMPSPPPAIMNIDYVPQELRVVNGANYAGYSSTQQVVTPATELDAYYWRNMFKELGFGDAHTMCHEGCGHQACPTPSHHYLPATGSAYG